MITRSFVHAPLRAGRILAATAAIALSATALLTAQEAQAQSGTGVLYYYGQGGMSWAYSNTSYVSAGMTAAGATSFSRTTTWPSSLSSYRVVFIVSGTSGPSATQRSQISAFERAGGVVVIISDAATYGYNPEGNSWAAAANTSMRFSNSNVGGGCTTASGSNLNSSNSVMSGVTRVGWGYASPVSGGTWLIRNGSTTVASNDGNVVLIGDGNMMNVGSCGLSGSTSNTRFFRNLWNLGCTARTWYLDSDGDTWGGGSSLSACTAPTNYVARSGDCDDSDRFTFPGATEVIADGKDQSCDGTEVCYENLDGDGYRTNVTTTSSDPDCADSGEALATLPSVDCDDSDPLTFPGATEIVGDEKDQSCDGTEVCYADLDDDGWRTTSTVASADIDCTDTTEATALEPTFDCDDSDNTIYPGATEIAYDGIDQDCSGDDLCDVDLDGFDATAGSCVGTDCNDADDTINPIATEIWYDGTDQDCDGWSDYDADYDGFDSIDYEGDDCDDADYEVNPDADEIWYDGTDQNCDGWSDYDQDQDGYDSADYGGEDCDDLDETVFPGAPELDDGIDNDCNGVDEDDDTDGDGVPDEDEFDLGTDPFDADSDGDGVSDGDEVGEDLDNPNDTDGDGTIDALDTDDDGDGIPSVDEVGLDGEVGGDPLDSDGDGTPDYLDLDSDDDGFDDSVEGDGDSDRDGTPDYLDLDSDGDTVLDVDEEPGDSDNDGTDDRLDTDDDGDGWSTSVEESWENRDLDGDGVPNYLDPDSDGDDTLDVDEGPGDNDCDGLANVVDADDFDGPCGQADAIGYQSGACTGASTSGAPVGLGGLALGLLALAGLRRRRS